MIEAKATSSPTPTSALRDRQKGDPKTCSQEAFDSGVWAALDLCRQARQADEKYNPFEAFEQRVILLGLRATEGNQLRAAKLLGISRSTLRKRMKKHKILIGMKIIGSA